MTENEAKEYMENEVECIKRASHCNRDCLKCELVKEEEPLIESYDMAIKALEEIQQYRAMEKRLGNVSINEIVDGFIEVAEEESTHQENEYEAFQAYRAIGTVEECRTAVERMKPKKPIIKNWCPAICPTCKCELSESLGDGYYKHYEGMKYCECGQALDWE